MSSFSHISLFYLIVNNRKWTNIGTSDHEIKTDQDDQDLRLSEMFEINNFE